MARLDDIVVSVRDVDKVAQALERADRLEQALRGVLPLAKACVEKGYAYSCDHECDWCYCDQEAADKAAIAAAVAALEYEP